MSTVSSGTKMRDALLTELARWDRILDDRMERLQTLMDEPNGLEYKAVLGEAIEAQRNVSACQSLLDGWT